MEYRRWYEEDINTSLLGFGAMRLKTVKNEIDEEKAMALIDHAYKNGVNYFDTAMPYTDGKNESFLGKALKRYPRESFYLATKLSLPFLDKKEDADDLINRQLDALQTNYIDMYLLHAMNKENFKIVKEWGLLDILKRWKKEGKIRYIGFSFHDDYATFKHILDYYDWDFCQIQLNYLDTDIQQGLRGYYDLEARKIPVVVMEPVKGGKLAGFKKPIEKIFTDYSDASIASWALRWVGSLPGVKVILSGMNEMEQVTDNINIFKSFRPLDEEEKLRVEAVKKALLSVKAVGCTHCKYCLPCTVGIDIPMLFNILNSYRMFEDVEEAKYYYDFLRKNTQPPTSCIECGKCVKLCPQHINIPEELKKVTSEMPFIDF